MKYLISFICLIAFSLTSFAQDDDKQAVISIGYSPLNLSYDESVPLALTNPGSMFVSIDYTPKQDFAFGIEASFDTEDKDFNLWDVKIKVGVLLNRKKRIQFPIYAIGGIFSQEEPDFAEYGGFTWGAKAGVRLYITNKIGIEAQYIQQTYSVSMLDGNNLDESLGNFRNSSFQGGLALFFDIN